MTQQVTSLSNQVTKLQSNGQTTKVGKFAALAQCGFGAPTQVFQPWGDPDFYSLAPGGDTGSTSGWVVKNVSAASDRDGVSAAAGSLVFTNGDSEAVTSVMCVNLNYPTLRFFLKDVGGNGKANLEVTVIYQGLDGNPHTLSLAQLSPGSAWQPSPIIPIATAFLATLSPSGTTPVSFDFKVHGLQKGETFSIDGIYVDPRMGV
ncbi:MAG: hypothetical protein JOZ56_12060 [Actinobacteria bacterium]|nr:hypothetical protein [Actinomycetota bacterium]MBV8563816.1 hypothetical protein [Actinomycetota bacterium]